MFVEVCSLMLRQNVSLSVFNTIPAVVAVVDGLDSMSCAASNQGILHLCNYPEQGSHRQPIAVSDISIYICLIDIRDGSSKLVYGGVDPLQALSSAKTGRRSCFFMN